MSRLINANYGMVRSVSPDKTNIRISMPRGGSFVCRNEGFEIGQEVCFILDTLNRQVIKVLPKEVADMQLLMGLNPDLQEALQEEPLNDDAEIIDDIALMEELTNGRIHNVTSERCEDEEYIDNVCRKDREGPEGRDYSDWPANQR